MLSIECKPVLNVPCKTPIEPAKEQQPLVTGDSGPVEADEFPSRCDTGARRIFVTT